MQLQSHQKVCFLWLVITIGHVVSRRRASLDPKTVATLVFLAANKQSDIGAGVHKERARFQERSKIQVLDLNGFGKDLDLVHKDFGFSYFFPITWVYSLDAVSDSYK
jgi:hypothetical protein